MKFDVEFNINRFPIRLQHRAVELAGQHGLGDVLFPSDKGTGHTALPHLRSACTHTHTHLFMDSYSTSAHAHMLGISSLIIIGTQRYCNLSYMFPCVK